MADLGKKFRTCQRRQSATCVKIGIFGNFRRATSKISAHIVLNGLFWSSPELSCFSKSPRVLIQEIQEITLGWKPEVTSFCVISTENLICAHFSAANAKLEGLIVIWRSKALKAHSDYQKNIE